MKSFIIALSKRPFLVVAVICASIWFIASNHYRWRQDNWRDTISSDGLGYYSYLPAAFIYDDWKFSYYDSINVKYHHHTGFAPFLNGTEYGLVDKYYCGESVMHSPFFAASYLYAKCSGAEADGYSKPFQIGMSISCICYILLGLYALYRWLLHYVKPTSAALALMVLYLGSNLFYYSVFEPSAVHSFAFAAVAFFIYTSSIAMEKRRLRDYASMAALGGLIFLLRPTDLIVAVALPVIAGSWSVFTDWLKGLFQWKCLTLCLAIFAALVFFQCYAYYQQIGRWWVYAYGIETFDFLHPHFWEVLFGFRVGLFIYSPILWLALPGIWLLWKRNGFAAVFLLIFIAANTWIISSWWMWHYEGTTGMRPYIDHLGWFALPLALTFDISRVYIRYILLPISLFLLFLVSTLAWQRNFSILPWSDMNFWKFKALLFQKHEKYRHLFTHKNVPGLMKDTDDLRIFMFSKNGQVHKPDTSETLVRAGEDWILHRVAMSDLENPEAVQCDLQGMVRMPQPDLEMFTVIEWKRDGKSKDWQQKHLMEATARPDDLNWFFQVQEWQDDFLPNDSIIIHVRNDSHFDMYVSELKLTLASSHHE